MRLGLCLRPALARDYGFAHVCLTALDYPDAAFDELLHASLAAYEAESCERLPHREIEQQWITRAWCGNADHRWPDGQLVRHSMLGRPIDALNASRDDIYAFTHALLYATDLGRTTIRIPRAKRMLLADAEATLARCLDSEDYDLGGEVLLTWPLLGAAWSATASFGFKVLARVEDQVGFLPAPLTRLDRYRSFARGEERSRYVLATVYHTAYVMGLLCAITLDGGKPLPLKTWGRVGSGSEVNLGDLLDLLHGASPRHDGKDPHWLSDFQGLAPHEQDVLAPMLLTIALQRAARTHNLKRMRDTLELGVRLGLVLGPGPQQAAQLLQRAAALTPCRATSPPLPDEPQLP